VTDAAGRVTGVIDYHTGNSRSVARALQQIGVPHRLLKLPGDLDGIDRVILPGVGAAETTMGYLAQAGWPAALRALVAEGGMPFLGICVGLQVLFEHSEEQDADCLGWLPGTVRSFGKGLRVPQIGWNQVRPCSAHPFMAAFPGNGDFYFVNSYYAPADGASVAATTEYGTPFASVVATRNVMATQFHAEKSGPAGLSLLRRFTSLSREELCR
jgi:imidazole glycerol-phosphate synthase subunit HisH